ncbi:MAG: hypothetical protein RIR62_1991, partial [Pseudomonadota bacterium]
DALRALPGVAVNGAGDSSTQVRIRGGESSHTLILIDGIAAAGGEGEYNLGGLETMNIERIEVLRGPQSVYYGSNASAGVINIVTKKGAEGTTATAGLEAGAGTIATAFIARRDARGGVSLSLSHADDRGYDQSGDGGEKDGIRRSTAILSGDYLVTDDLQLGFTLRRSREGYDFDANSFSATDAAGYVVDDPDEVSDRNDLTAGIFAEYAMLDGRLTHRLGLERTDNDASFNGGAPTQTTTDALKYRLSFGLDGAVADADHLLMLFLEKREDASSSNPAYGRAARSAALEYRGSLDMGLDVQAGLRFDDNSTFPDSTTWNVGLSYTLDTGIRLHASAGTGVVNPNYFELYADAFGYRGNPNLQPEKNRSVDLGVEFPVFAERGTIDITIFRETLTDEITDVPLGGNAFGFVNQSGDSDRQGVEVQGDVQATDDLSLRMAYTYLDATNPDGSVEIRRPRHELMLGATLAAFGGRGTVSGDLRHVSGNVDTQFWGNFDNAPLPAYTTVNLSARYDLTDSLQLTGRVENLFDADAVDVWGYATRGRALYVGIDAKF